MIAHRYGWADDIIDNLTLEYFCDLVRYLSREKSRADQRRMADSFNLALIAYRTAMDNEKISFAQYLRGLGLTEETMLQKDANITAKEAVAKAERILEKMGKRRQ